MSWSKFLPYVAVMAVVTYLIRMLPMTVYRRPIRSRFARLNRLAFLSLSIAGMVCTVPQNSHSQVVVPSSG